MENDISFIGTFTTSMAMFFVLIQHGHFLALRDVWLAMTILDLPRGFQSAILATLWNKRESWIDSEWEIKIDMIYLIRTYALWFFKIAMKTMGTCIDEHNNDFITHFNQYLMIMLETYLLFFTWICFRSPHTNKKQVLQCGAPQM